MRHAPPDAARPWSDPMGKLMQQRQPRIELVAARTDGEDTKRGTGDSRGMSPAPRAPSDDRWRLDARVGADRVDELRRPGWKSW